MHFFSMCGKIMRQHPPSVEEKLTVSVPFSTACTMLKNAPLYFWHQSVPLCDKSARIPLIGFHKLHWKYFTQISVNVPIFISKIGMLAAAFFFPSLLNSSSDFMKFFYKNLNVIWYHKETEKAYVARHYPLHSFSLHVFSWALISHTPQKTHCRPHSQ